MMQGKRLSLFVWGLVAVAGLSRLGMANSIVPGGINTPVPSADATGAILADTGLVSYSFLGGAGTGTVRELVVADALNPYASGDLTFIYQVHVGTGEAVRLSGFDYAGFLTDVSQFAAHGPLITTGTHTAEDATRSADGSVVGFEFTVSPILGLSPSPNDTTDTSVALLIRTNATMFGSGTIGVIDGGGDTVMGFAPSAVPTPATGWAGAGLLGVIGTGAWLRRRQTVALEV
jgi:hypothetical protein